MIIFAAEAVFVAYGRRRQWGNLLTVDLVFGCFLGIPLVWSFYTFAIDMPTEAVALIAVKQTVNGLFNALVAGLGLTLVQVLRRRERKIISYAAKMFQICYFRYF